MSDELQRIIGDLLARMAAVEKATEENGSWIKKGIFGIIGTLFAIAVAYARSLGLF